MITLVNTVVKKSLSAFAVAALMASYLVLAGCGSTKVYTADKTMVYNGNLYNLTQVEQIGSAVDLQSPGGESVDAGNMDKSGVKSLLDQHDTLTMTTQFLLDEKKVVYERVSIDSYSDYSKHMKRFDKARRHLTDFMSDAKETQLQLD